MATTTFHTDSQCVAGGGGAAPEPYLERLYEPSRRLSRRESDYMRSPILPLPESPMAHARSHSVRANSTASNQMRRTSSVMRRDAERPLTRTQRSTQSELLQFYASQQLPRTSSEFLQELQAAATNSQFDARQSRRASSVAGASLARTTSDLSLYAPVRRRSVIQTPGVATRPRREERPSIPDRSSSRKSQPVFGDDPYTFKPGSGAPKHLSMPPMPIGFGPLERAVTPCESDYKQLGGIKFGSLKIMNASPPSSPRDNAKQRRVESSAVPSSSDVAPGDSGIELSMARLKHRHTVIGSVAESRASASVSGFRSSEGACPKPPNRITRTTDDLKPSPLLKAASPLLGYPDVGESEGASSGGRGGVRRSNSGFGSTTSSESSQRTSSKTDSGYSSNASERSFLSSRNVDDSSYVRQRQPRRRTLEQPTPAPMITADGIKKHRKLYKPFVRLERDGAAAKDTTKEAVDDSSSSGLAKPRAKRHEKHRYVASSSCLPSHKVDASSATLNTIMSADNLVPSDDNAPSSHSAPELEAGKDGSKSLKKRRSLRKMAEAATSRMPSLSLSRRRSAAAGEATPSSKADTQKRRRAISLVNGNASAAANSSGPYSHAMLPAISSPPNQEVKGSSSLKDRASAPELRVAIPDHTALGRGAANRSSYSTLGTPSPRTPRFRGVMDPGVPPPIPPQFRTPSFGALPALAVPSNSPSWPLVQPTSSWDGAQLRREDAEMEQAIQPSPAGRGVLESPISPRHRQPTRGNPPTYRGVRI
ncbi:hypothetical protein Trco_007590 [Trichoderma cornu-damae]|uniref:Proteophosphoglycan ppg4 n=1 Tax=Trichoderma cornu-damae TaxID=654480 RepID=A0A9P8TT76_9HYPO|nr:hypothetical protein Trco_007590 [Trichoderma cornu-damae]